MGCDSEEATTLQSISDAVKAERERCIAWARALRSGQIDDIRSVIYGISSGVNIDVDE